MNAPVLTYTIEIAKPHKFEDLASVRLLHAVETDEGEGVAAGTIGTVVGLWADGAAYEVEFAVGLATVEAGDLAAIDAE